MFIKMFCFFNTPQAKESTDGELKDWSIVLIVLGGLSMVIIVLAYAYKQKKTKEELNHFNSFSNNIRDIDQESETQTPTTFQHTFGARGARD